MNAFCVVCKRSQGPLKQCGQCLGPIYCSDECQVMDWQTQHGKVCKPPSPLEQNLVDFTKRLETHLNKMEFPQNVGDMDDLNRKLKQRNRHLDRALEETRSMSATLLRSRGASAQQIAFIQKEMDTFQKKLLSITEAGLLGKEMPVTAMADAYAHANAAQTTIHIISGRPPVDEKKEEEILVKEMSGIANQAGRMLAKYALKKEPRRMPSVQTQTQTQMVDRAISIPHLIGDNGSWADIFRRYVPTPGQMGARAYNFLAETIRDVVFCLSESPDRSYSKLRRTLLGQEVEKEHKRAMVQIQQQKLGGLAIKAAEWIEDAANMLDALSLNTDPEVEEEWEAKRQTASICFSIALGTAFGVYTGLCWTRPEAYKKEAIARLTARNISLANDRKDQQIVNETYTRWDEDQAQYEDMRAQSQIMEPKIMQRIGMFGSVARRDTSFREALDAAVSIQTGCNISSTSGQIEGGSARAVGLPSSAELSVGVKDFILKTAAADRLATSQSIGNGLWRPVESTSQEVEIFECDPTAIMPALKNVGDKLFATAESMIQQATKPPAVPEEFYQTEMARASRMVEEQRQVWTNLFSTIPSTKDWARNNPEALAQVLATFNQANPNLSASLIASIQKSMQTMGEEQTQKTALFENMKDMAILLRNSAKQQNDTLTACISAEETWVAEEDARIRGLSIPANPINFATGTLTYAITNLLTVGTLGQQQFASGYMSSLATAYDAFFLTLSNVTWAQLGTTLAEFLTKALVLVWWLHVGLFEIVLYSGLFVIVVGLLGVLIDRALKSLFGGPVRKVAEDAKSKTPSFVRDEGTAVHGAVMDWLFSIATSGPVAFGVRSFIQTILTTAGGLSLLSLGLIVMSSSIVTLGNIIMSGPNILTMFGEVWTNLPQCFTSLIFATPMFVWAFDKAGNDRWHCLRRLLLTGSLIANLSGAAQTTFQIPLYGEVVSPSWEAYVFGIYVLWQFKHWYMNRNKIIVVVREESRGRIVVDEPSSISRTRSRSRSRRGRK